MAAALSRVYAGLCRRDRLTSKECPFWLYLFCGIGIDFGIGIDQKS
jgi:D-serine dehydratase